MDIVEGHYDDYVPMVEQEVEGGTMRRIPVRTLIDDMPKPGSVEYYTNLPEGGGGDPGITEAQRRKQRPVYSGVLKYFPLALMEVAHCSYLGQQQHNPGKPLAWDRSKSGDELDALVRHLMQADEKDTDGVYHAAKVAWRALAYLEKLLEKE